MIHKLLATLLAIGLCLIACIPQATAAESYDSVFYDWVTDGQSVRVSDYYVTFGVTNSSNTVNVTLSGPTVPESYRTPRNIVAGSSAYYGGLLRVYVDRIDGSRALVDVSKPGSSSMPSTGTRVTCDIPGQTALGGDVVSFPIVIQNYDSSDHTYTLSSFSDIGWKTWFEYGSKGVYKLFVPAGQSRSVDLKVQTWGNTPVGEKTIVAYVDNIRTELSVYITSANQSADVSYKVSSKIASIGDKITYDLHIKNVQARENAYNLSVTGLPDNWYARFKETATSTEEMAEVVIPASSEKDLVLEIVPPYSVAPGSYNFTSVVAAPDGVAMKNSLSLALKSGVGMSVTSSRLAYDAKPGQTFNVVVYVSNTGQGAALTNVYTDVTASDGWQIQSSPNRTNSIKAGETQAFTIAIQPPGNIVASDYSVTVNVKSDQAEKELDYRITITTDSYIPYIGAGIIILVVAGLFLLYRKYGRR
jgi:uncharacterized membrane protein